MKELIQKIIRFFTTDLDAVLPPDTYPLGAIQNEHDVDNRDIVLATVQSPVALSDEFDTDLSMFPVFNQGQLGTCVAHAFALTKMFLDYMETKILAIYSRRFLYVLSRLFSNMPTTDNMADQGLYPRQAAKVLSTLGIIAETDLDDNTLSHSAYISKYNVTDAMKKEGVKNRSGKYAFPFHDAESLKQALVQNMLVPATIFIDWTQIEADGTTHAPKRAIGTHEIVLCGYSNKTSKIKYRNSWGSWWGTKGYGFIPYAETEAVIYDAMVFADVPNDLIARAKGMQYIFLTNMAYGASGEAIKELQKRLMSYGLLQVDAPTGYYGLQTQTAVRDFQALKGIAVVGSVGPATRAALNAETPAGYAKSKIDLWVEQAIRIEGAKPALNNPGNIRCNGIMNAKATGMDYRGFCVFPTYEVGYTELRNIFTRAAGGGSKVYRPDMNLYEFYAVYAPDNDGNNSRSYAEQVAAHIGVSPTVQIRTLL